MPVAVWMACGHPAFPDRLLCPRCGGGDWRRKRVETGTVEEVTLVRRTPGHVYDTPVRLGSVRLADGPVVIARLDEGLERGSRARVDLEGGAPVAHAL